MSWIENSAWVAVVESSEGPECYLFLLSCVLGVGWGCVGMSNFREVWESSVDRDTNMQIRSGSMRHLSQGGLGGLTVHSHDPQFGAGNSRIFWGKLRLVRTWQWEPAGLEMSGVSTMMTQGSGRICMNWFASKMMMPGAGESSVDRWWDTSTRTLVSHPFMLCSSFEAWGQSWRHKGGGETWVVQGQISTISAIRLADRIKFN